jgi:flagellar biosynthesis/type III secretory pathway protein FliH
MLFTEWNWDDAASPNGDAENPFLSASAPQWAHDALAVRFEEGMEEGLEEGQNMVLELMREGYSAEQIEAKLAAVKSGISETAGK